MKLKQLIDSLYSGVKLKRFDLIIRYLFVKEHIEGSTKAEKLYNKLIRERLKYKPERMKDYSSDKFRKLIDDIKNNGIKEPVCISKNGELMGGSHRIACAMYLNIDVPTITKDVLFRIRSPFNVDWFIDNNFNKKEIKYLIEMEEKIFEKYKPKNDVLFENKIRDILNSEEQKFGYVNYKKSFYQGFTDLGIEGQRSSELRFHIYKLDDILNYKYSVLDIGCNCGFLSLMVSKYVNKVTGIDYNKSLIKISNEVKDHLNIGNCIFKKMDFERFKTDETYDVILCLSLYKHLTNDIKFFVEKIDMLLKPNGFFVFESHNLKTLGKSFDDDVRYFIDRNYCVVNSGVIKDDGVISRKFVVLQKRIVCRWCDAILSDDLLCRVEKGVDIYGCLECMSRIDIK